jgi:hypothetical protein
MGAWSCLSVPEVTVADGSCRLVDRIEEMSEEICDNPPVKRVCILSPQEWSPSGGALQAIDG